MVDFKVDIAGDQQQDSGGDRLATGGGNATAARVTFQGRWERYSQRPGDRPTDLLTLGWR